jgi:hypothetical protein
MPIVSKRILDLLQYYTVYTFVYVLRVHTSEISVLESAYFFEYAQWFLPCVNTNLKRVFFSKYIYKEQCKKLCAKKGKEDDHLPKIKARLHENAIFASFLFYLLFSSRLRNSYHTNCSPTYNTHTHKTHTHTHTRAHTRSHNVTLNKGTNDRLTKSPAL